MERFEKAWKGEQRMTKQEQRFQAAVAAMQALIGIPEWNQCHWDVMADAAVDAADELLSRLDRTAPKDEPQPEYGTGGKMMLEPRPEMEEWFSTGRTVHTKHRTHLFRAENPAEAKEAVDAHNASLRIATIDSLTVQPNDDGWHRHIPGDPMPDIKAGRIEIMTRDGSLNSGNPKYFDFGISFGDDSDEIVAWRVAE